MGPGNGDIQHFRQRLIKTTPTFSIYSSISFELDGSSVSGLSGLSGLFGSFGLFGFWDLRHKSNGTDQTDQMD